MFIIKKIVSPLFLPLSIIVLILIIGLIFLWLKKRQKAGRLIITAGVLLLVLFSYDFFSDRLIAPLEQRYPPLLLSSESGTPLDDELKSVKWIVVLGGGHTDDHKVPVTSRISSESLFRVVEAVRIYKNLPDTKIIFSGGAVFSKTPEANTSAQVAEILGVPQQKIIREIVSRDTEDHAKNILPIVGADKFILVTSASHLPRSMALFSKQGMSPIAAPAGHEVLNKEETQPRDFYPRGNSLVKAELAFHEYMGLMWSKLRNKI